MISQVKLKMKPSAHPAKVLPETVPPNGGDCANKSFTGFTHCKCGTNVVGESDLHSATVFLQSN
jgi:hypothetical protein